MEDVAAKNWRGVVLCRATVLPKLPSNDLLPNPLSHPIQPPVLALGIQSFPEQTTRLRLVSAEGANVHI